MPLLKIVGVSKSFGAGQALRGVDLDVREGEILGLLGPSGCGKSTLLRVIAGIETVSQGRIELDGADIMRTPPQSRDIAMVFQSLALYPHMTVRQNIALPLRVRRMSRLARALTPLRNVWPGSLSSSSRTQEQNIAREVEDLAEKLGIVEQLDKRPRQLSGGQQQRVAIARAIIRGCRLLLLDEPFSSLDAKVRITARDEIVRIQRQFGLTCVFVTHDQSEALAISDRVAVMLEGRIAQVAPPRNIYRDPASLAVARFVGVPSINTFACCVSANGRIYCNSLGVTLNVGAPERSRVTLAVRPESVRLLSTAGDGAAAHVQRVEELGHERVVHLASDDPEVGAIAVRVGSSVRHLPGERVFVRAAAEDLMVFADDGARIAVWPHTVAERAHA